MQGSPDEFFHKFLRLSIRLSENAQAWPIKLCSAYFVFPSKEWVDLMLNRGFKMPLLVNLNTKSKRFPTFQEAIESASTNF